MRVVLESVLTCPHCGCVAQETMPTDACLFSMAGFAHPGCRSPNLVTAGFNDFYDWYVEP